MDHLFCFGLGYTATALARALMAAGWQVAGTFREPGKRDSLAAIGIESHSFDGTGPLPATERLLAGCSHILISIPPGPEGDPVLAHHATDIAAVGGLRWLGYLSTTGVYGDRDGGWVDEDTEFAPTGPRGERRVAAEQGWLRLWREHGVPVHIFRLAGIYGPGRNALETVRSGAAKRIDKPGQVFSRIHVEDIVQVLRASMAHPRPGAAYNVCDDDPAPPADVIAYAADLLNVPPPPLVPFEQAELSPMAQSFYRDNKRVRNARIKDELGVTLRFPSYKAGLDALYAQDG
ncbi:MAG: SDR family oxidoreductase [Alphaproteobacteria bacterium]|nr:SDR family oxidoreductase [Alphaproteobacteria bacterium]